MVEEPLMDAMLSNDSRSTYNFGDVRSDMRHNSTASTKTYLADAATMFELVKSSSKDPKDTKVGVYRGILVKNPEVVRKVLGKKNKMTLVELANWYVFDILKADPKQMSINDIFKKAFNKNSKYKPEAEKPVEMFLFQSLV